MTTRLVRIGAVALSLLSPAVAKAQTLEETALFIMTGNATARLVDTGDRFKVSNNRESSGIALKMTPDEQEGEVSVLKMSPDTCVFQMETVTLRPHRSTGKVRPVKSVQRVDFSKIDPSNITEGPRNVAGRLFRSVQMKGGDNETNCKWLETPEDGKIPIYCSPMVDREQSDMAGNYERLPKAIKHLYGTYCKGNKRAF